MKIPCSIVIVLTMFLSVSGQENHRIDSLIHVLTNARDDSSKAIAIWSLGREYVYYKPDSCLFYARMGLDLVKDQSVKDLFLKTDNPLLYSFELRMYSIMGSALAELRNDTLAVKMELKALELAKKSKDKYDLGRTYGGVAEVYQFIEEPGIAIEYLRKQIALDTNDISRYSLKVELGANFFDKGEYDSALYYLKDINPAYMVNDLYLWPYPHLYLGKTYAKKGQFKTALGFYKTAIDYAKQSNFISDLSDAYLCVADVYWNLHIKDSAVVYANNALLIAKDLSLPDKALQTSLFLAKVYDSTGNLDSATKYYKASIQLKDSLQSSEKIKRIQNYAFDEKIRQQEIEEQELAYNAKVRMYSMLGGILSLAVIAGILYRNNRNKQKLNLVLQTQKNEIQNTLSDLRQTQAQLVQSEKMASLGELASGIAHEIQNPLNFVNNFSDINEELLNEMKEEINAGHPEEAKSIADNVIENEQKIKLYGKRADAIVKGMLQHSRKSSGQKELIDINALAEEYIRLTYQAVRAKEKDFTAIIKTDFDPSLEKLLVMPQDIGRVLVNLFNNAFYALMEKAKQASAEYKPTLKIKTGKEANKIFLSIVDNGNGIPHAIIDKIFQPFFTTKPTGQGTGLGLSLSYDIMKAHGGEIKVLTNESGGTEFIILLPFTV